jgi:SWI/SNF-related matrix-associated actin-dependent regulator 1 of chromatin subfamily A
MPACCIYSNLSPRRRPPIDFFYFYFFFCFVLCAKQLFANHLEKTKNKNKKVYWVLQRHPKKKKENRQNKMAFRPKAPSQSLLAWTNNASPSLVVPRKLTITLRLDPERRILVDTLVEPTAQGDDVRSRIDRVLDSLTFLRGVSAGDETTVKFLGERHATRVRHALTVPVEGGAAMGVEKQIDLLRSSVYGAFPPTAASNCTVQFRPLSTEALRFLREPAPTERERWTRQEQRIRAALPGALFEKLFPYQRDTLAFCLDTGLRCIVALDMGLGKTLVAVASALVLMKEQSTPVVVGVVCLSSLCINWAREFLKWLNPDDKDAVLLIRKGKDFATYVPGKHRVVVTSYDLASTDEGASFMQRTCSFFIVDESHALKNAESKRSSRLVPILQRSRQGCLLLSGTPILSKPVELYQQIRAVRADMFPRFTDFAHRYCQARQVVVRRGNPPLKVWVYDGCENAAELNYVLTDGGGVMVRKLKQDFLAQLPSKTREVVLVEIDGLSGEQKQFAGTVSEENRTSILQLYHSIVPKKIPVVVEQLETMVESMTPDTKMIVFGHHSAMLDAIEECLARLMPDDPVDNDDDEAKPKKPAKAGKKRAAKKRTIARIDGSVSLTDRDEACRQFQEDPKCRFIVLSISAAGVGLTLTRANVVVFAELVWTAALISQAECRAHRIGQDRPVLVKYIVVADSVENQIWSMLERKIDATDRVMDNVHDSRGMAVETITSAVSTSTSTATTASLD